MLRETGRVESVQDGFAWVACSARIDCSLCAEGRGCGGGLLGRLLGDRLHRVRALSLEDGLAVGDRVELSLAESALVRGALQVYGLPLLGFIGLPVAAFWLSGLRSDFGLLGLALTGLLLGMLLARRLAASAGASRRYQPCITRKLSKQCAASGCPEVDPGP